MFMTKNNIFRRFYLLLQRILYKIFFKAYYKRCFKAYGENIGWGRFFSPIIPSSIKIACPENISIGDGCQIDENAKLIATPHSYIKIGNNVRITSDFANINAAFDTIEIEDDCLIGALIHNGNHGYADVDVPIKYQPMTSLGSILIKKGSWLAINSFITGGVTIGKNSVVGANSYVSKSVPDYCVVAGNPAKVVKRYDFEQKKWVKVSDVLK